MQLPHAEQQLASPTTQLLRTILNDAPVELELVASESGLDEIEGDDGEYLTEVSDKYYQCYDNLVMEISKMAGEPVFLGGLPDAFEWSDTLGIEPGFDKISVWHTEGKHVYLQIIWEDKDCPIVISLGAR
jgi:hypothetical protein